MNEEEARDAAVELIKEIATEEIVTRLTIEIWKDEARRIFDALYEEDRANELEHCPKCGSMNVSHESSAMTTREGNWIYSYWKVCKDCGATTPKYNNHNEVIADWNAGRVYVEDFPPEDKQMEEKTKSKAPTLGKHPLAEVIARKLAGIAGVPPKEAGRVVQRAADAAVEWHESVVCKSLSTCSSGPGLKYYAEKEETTVDRLAGREQDD